MPKLSLLGFLCGFLLLAGAPMAFAQQRLDTWHKYATPQQNIDSVVLGQGITAFNVTFTGDTGAFGFFKIVHPIGTTSSIGLDSGLILTTGSIFTTGTSFSKTGPKGPNSSSSAGFDNGAPGDADLDIVAGIATHNAAILEFDFIPISDSVKFDYIFGSDEYNEFVPQAGSLGINDVFAFYLNGVSVPMVKHNIAIVPGTANTPVSIFNVNNGHAVAGIASNGPCNHCSFFHDNLGGQLLEYDGYTTVLTAKEAVVCNETYHIKIAIADASDGGWDSGVLIKALSFSGGALKAFNGGGGGTTTNDSTFLEGCGQLRLIIERNSNVGNAEKIRIVRNPNSSAIKGIDYTGLPDTIQFNAGQRYDTVYVNFPQDYVIDSVDSLIISLATVDNPCPVPSVTLGKFFIVNVRGSQAIAFGDTTIACPGQPAYLRARAQGGVGDTALFTYLWSTGATTQAITVNPLVTTTYYVNSFDSCNTRSATDSVTVTLATYPPLVATATDTAVACYGFTTQLVGSATGGNPPYVTAWLGFALNQDTLTVGPTTNAQYQYVVTDACGTTDTAVGRVVISTAQAAFTADSINYQTFQFHARSPADALSLNWMFGDGKDTTGPDPIHLYTDTGSYTVTLRVVNSYGCMDTIDSVVTVTNPFRFYLPNAFTPNGDGINDVWVPNGTAFYNCVLHIFDRWGSEVFTGSDAQLGWNGNAPNGNAVQAGIYSYSIETKGTFRSTFSGRGTIVLIR